MPDLFEQRIQPWPYGRIAGTVSGVGDADDPDRAVAVPMACRPATMGYPDRALIVLPPLGEYPEGLACAASSVALAAADPPGRLVATAGLCPETRCGESVVVHAVPDVHRTFRSSEVARC